MHSSSSFDLIVMYSECGALIHIGDNCSISEGVVIASRLSVTADDDALIADNVRIKDGDGHCMNEEKEKIMPINDGKHVWIGAPTIILKGITIGNNVIVGSGSVITKDVVQPNKPRFYQAVGDDFSQKNQKALE
jgi:acetyltransferase-like isoleucine patch superfamily enzyme